MFEMLDPQGFKNLEGLFFGGRESGDDYCVLLISLIHYIRDNSNCTFIGEACEKF